uniref:Uncharacterized protein n=1 Tax=Rhodosorus marinus TaxID=101924 RepID=A0A6T6MUS9_9RHOD|mmetsp:Transcript_2412/g.3535  ORF Transcript_2412/g.3535 Transcript_2412/m.3535 type:complete len:139 (+) Transcript_2412:849-1265(+)
MVNGVSKMRITLLAALPERSQTPKVFSANVNHSAPTTLVSSVRSASSSRTSQRSLNSTRWDVVRMRELALVTVENVSVNVVPVMSVAPGYNALTVSTTRICFAVAAVMQSLQIPTNQPAHVGALTQYQEVTHLAALVW